MTPVRPKKMRRPKNPTALTGGSLNVNEFCLRHYDEYDGDVDKLARAYLEEALQLDTEQCFNALLPSVRSSASSYTSRIRTVRQGRPPAWADPPRDATKARPPTAAPPSAEQYAMADTAGPPPHAVTEQAHQQAD